MIGQTLVRKFREDEQSQPQEINDEPEGSPEGSVPEEPPKSELPDLPKSKITDLPKSKIKRQRRI